jgi:hypothetical protein
LTPKLAWWASFLDGFNFSIYHITGKTNPADAPSRRPDLLGEGPLIPNQSIVRRMVVANDVGGIVPRSSFHLYDLHFQRPRADLIEYFKKAYDRVSQTERAVLSERDGILWFQDRVYVPPIFPIRILQLFHDAPTVGHPGIARTLSLITRSFSWPGIRKEVIQYVNSCNSCQRVKARRQNPEGTLQPLPAPYRPWSVVGMDFITKLPVLGGFDSIMVVISL